MELEIIKLDNDRMLFGSGIPPAVRIQHRKFWLWDDTDNKFPPHRTFFLICSFLLYVVDVGLDVWVAVEYYIADRENTDPFARYYLAATLFFIIFPALVLNLISWGLYTWGWLIYRSKRLHQYCHRRLEPVAYRQSQRQAQTDNDVDQINTVVLDQVRTLRWPGHKVVKSRSCPERRRRRSDSSPIAEADDSETDSGLQFYPLDFFDSCEYIAVTIIHLCLLGYIFRVARLIYTRGRDKYSFDRYRDISFLRLIESFMESAPQLVLQLYLLVVHEHPPLWYKIVTPISIVFSIVSLALAVGDYISATKDIYHYDPPPNAEKKARLSWPGYLTVIFWHLFMVIARGLAFSLFATLYGAYVFLIAGLHYSVMVYWMYWQHARVFKRRPEDFEEEVTTGCASDKLSQLCCPCNKELTFTSDDRLSCRKLICFPCKKILFSNYGIELIVAAFNIFFHFKIKDGGFINLVPFYLLTFVENAIMILLWYFGRDYTMMIWYPIPALVTVFTAFSVGLVLLGSYYLCCQPKETLVSDGTVNHPTMTCSLNRMYAMKERRGNIFRRAFYSKKK